MSIAVACAHHAEGSGHVSPPSAATPLVLAAVAGGVFALVLFSLITVGAPSEFLWVLVLQLAAGNRRVLEKGRDRVRLVPLHAGLLP